MGSEVYIKIIFALIISISYGSVSFGKLGKFVISEFAEGYECREKKNTIARNREVIKRNANLYSTDQDLISVFEVKTPRDGSSGKYTGWPVASQIVTFLDASHRILSTPRGSPNKANFEARVNNFTRFEVTKIENSGRTLFGIAGDNMQEISIVFNESCQTVDKKVVCNMTAELRWFVDGKPSKVGTQLGDKKAVGWTIHRKGKEIVNAGTATGQDWVKLYDCY